MPLLLLLAGEDSMGGFKQTVSWRDAQGHTSKTVFYVDAANATTAATHAAALINLMIPLTRAVFQGALGPVYSKPALQYGDSGQFSSIEDRLVLYGAVADGQSWHLSIPAPVAAAFLADLDTADLTNAGAGSAVGPGDYTATGGGANAHNGNSGDMEALITAITTTATGMYNAQDSLVNLVYAGLRKRSKTRRKFGPATKSPGLIGPGE